jgi:hypothetical protein
MRLAVPIPRCLTQVVVTELRTPGVLHAVGFCLLVAKACHYSQAFATPRHVSGVIATAGINAASPLCRARSPVACGLYFPAVKGGATMVGIRQSALKMFTCPNCQALYQVVKVERGLETVDRDVACSCGSPLPGREGNFVLKFHAAEGGSRKGVGDAAKLPIGRARIDHVNDRPFPRRRDFPSAHRSTSRLTRPTPTTPSPKGPTIHSSLTTAVSAGLGQSLRPRSSIDHASDWRSGSGCALDEWPRK